MVYCQSIVIFIDWWNSSVTYDIAKIDNYSVYRQLGNNRNYRRVIVEIAARGPMEVLHWKFM